MTKNESSFTLVELLIVIAIVSIVGAALLVLLNPWQQIGKGWDARRKHDLDVLKKVLEDWYNDKGCYPRAEEICYNTPVNRCPGTGGHTTAGSKTCHICGLESGSATANSNFSSYLNGNKLPCDPQHALKDYFYQVEVSSCKDTNQGCTGNACPSDYCPTWYRIYTNLSNKNDSQSQELGCIKGGCGLDRSTTYFPSPTPPFGYDYAITNGKVLYEYSKIYVCLGSGQCNACGPDYNACVANSFCSDRNKIYGTGQACCLANPGASGC